MLYWIIAEVQVEGGEIMSKILILVVLLIVAFGAFAFLGGKKTNNVTQKSESISPTVTQPSNSMVNIILSDKGFLPKDITIKKGTKVVWVNKSGKTATVNSDDHPTHRLYPFLNLGQFADGATLEAVVAEAGKYSYHNHLDASETGTVTAQ